MNNKYRSSWLTAIALAGILILGSCGGEPAEAPAARPAAEPPAWMNTELTDVATGKTFRISDFRGKPVLIESFAVWCPTCLRQQKQMLELLETEGEAIVHVSLDTDPNEDEAKVREHIERNGLNWYFAVAPEELSRALIDQFGLTVVSAPSAPVILICQDQSARFLKSGVKSAADLLTEVEKGCR